MVGNDGEWMEMEGNEWRMVGNYGELWGIMGKVGNGGE